MLNKKIVVITGGLGQIGLATIEMLSKLGATIICLTKRNENNKKIVKDLEIILCDIRNTNEIQKSVNFISEKYNRIDILINNAGVTYDVKKGDIETITDEVLDKIIDTNLKGTFKIIREFKQLLAKSDSSLIINISSTSSIRASRSNPIYAASKAAINLLTQTLALHLSPKIRVVGIAPGYLEKPVSGAKKLDGFNEKVAELIPLKRIGSALDVANTIECIILKMPWCNGHTIVLDGGMTI